MFKMLGPSPKQILTRLPGEPVELGAFLRARAGVVGDEADQIIRDGAVHVNGRRQVNPQYRCPVGAKIVVAASVSMPAASPRLVFSDDCLAVLDKPAGLATMATRQSARALDAWAIAELDRAAVALHRLDREASGLVLFSLSKAGRARLTEMFRGHQIDRRYLALVRGTLRGQGAWTAPVAGKSAYTEYEVVETRADATLLRLQLRTGRTHQIRVHAQQAGHALVGDTRYGGPPGPRLMLHAYRLCFLHPITAEKMRFTSPAPTVIMPTDVIGSSTDLSSADAPDEN